MKRIIIKVFKMAGYAILAVIMLWAAKEVLLTSVDKSQKGDNLEHTENQIP
ncbi:MAG: hypothetical protein IJ588_13670 [Prevotella sp.]|nr:hypothetical protein [Prevotella sp.]